MIGKKINYNFSLEKRPMSLFLELPCDSMPCVNGGSCFADGSTYICECREGYAGQRCELIL